MNNQTIATAGATLITCVNWNRTDLVPQNIIDAAKSGRLQGPLTDWLASQSWNQGKFVVRDHFKVDTSRNAKVKICEVRNNFMNWFWNTVEDLPPTKAPNVFTLPRYMYDKDIILELGGVPKAVSSLGEMFRDMENQQDGPKSAAGLLLTNGYANIRYIPQPVKKLDDKRFSYVGLEGREIFEEVKDSQYLFEIQDQWFVLRAVDVCWYGGGWGVLAGPVGYPCGWDGGVQVFSRNSALKPSETPVPATA